MRLLQAVDSYNLQTYRDGHKQHREAALDYYYNTRSSARWSIIVSGGVVVRAWRVLRPAFLH